MLSMRISYLRVCSACAPVPYAYAQHGLKGPLSICNFYLGYKERPFEKWEN
jgi:hypothetical protein